MQALSISVPIKQLYLTVFPSLICRYQEMNLPSFACKARAIELHLLFYPTLLAASFALSSPFWLLPSSLLRQSRLCVHVKGSGTVHISWMGGWDIKANLGLAAMLCSLKKPMEEQNGFNLLLESQHICAFTLNHGLAWYTVQMQPNSLFHLFHFPCQSWWGQKLGFFLFNSWSLSPVLPWRPQQAVMLPNPETITEIEFLEFVH